MYTYTQTVIKKKNALFRCLFFGMVHISQCKLCISSVIREGSNVCRAWFSSQPSLLGTAILWSRCKPFRQSCFTPSVSGHVLRLIHVHEQSTFSLYPWTHWWLPSTWEAHKTRKCYGLARLCCPAAAWMQVASNMICSWSNTAGVSDSNNLSRKVTVNHTWFTTVLLFNYFLPLCFMICIMDRSLFFNLTNDLMPYLLLSFGTCLADLPNQYVPFCSVLLLYISRSLRWIRNPSLWFERQIHVCWADAQCKKNNNKECKIHLYVNYQY